MDGVEDEVEDKVETFLFPPRCYFGENYVFKEPLHIEHGEFCNAILKGCSSCFCNLENLSLVQFGISM